MTIDTFCNLLANKIIPENEKNQDTLEELSYGICAVLTSSINLTVAGIIAYFLGIFTHYCIFLLTFIPIRISHTGYHCKTFLNCAILSNVTFLMCSLFLTSYTSMTSSLYSYIFIVLLFFHYFISNEKYLILTFVIVMIHFILKYFGYHFELYFIVSILLNSILILGGKLYG